MNRTEEFDQYYSQALELITNGMPHDFIKPPAFKEEYIEKIKEKLRIKRNVPTTADCLGSNDNEFWYHPDNFEHFHWGKYKSFLESKNFPQTAIEDIDTSTTKIMKMICNPREKEFRKHGLVVGYVQSGKTANYTGLIAKAIDCGYKNIIILSGIHNNLRDQTQRRIESDLENYSLESPELNIQYLTNKGEEDFDDNLNRSTLLTPNPKIAIIKKQHTVLGKVFNWFYDIDEEVLSSHSTIIIDDEADNATIDVSNDYEESDDPYTADDDPSLTNRLIKQIRNLFPKICYIGYTATPFANVLIDPFEEHESYRESLYPRDFIISLPKPFGYTGVKELFPNLVDTEFNLNKELSDNVFIINNNDHNQLIDSLSVNFIDIIPESLKKAFYRYLITALVKKKRGFQNYFHSFLIHASHEINIHQLIREKFDTYFDNFSYHFCLPKPLDNQIRQEINNLKDYWDEKRVEFKFPNLSFEKIKPDLIDIVKSIKVVDVNSESKEELNFTENSTHNHYIIIGGNRLSRGLTIEGLTITYFSRFSKYYDSFLQMGRWFGFRKDYEDLVMLYTTAENFCWFNWLNNVEESMRMDIKRYDSYNKTPLDLAVRIMTHPGMHVTSPIKMKNVVYSSLKPNYNERIEETKEFDLSPLALQKNINTVGRLIETLKSNYKLQANNQKYLWTKVSKRVCVNFIKKFIIPEDSTSFSKNDILSYIDEVYESHSELTKWSVLLHDNTKSKKEPYDIAGYKVGISNRQKHIGLNVSPIIRQNNLFNIDLNEDSKRKSDNPLLIIHIIDCNGSVGNGYEPWNTNKHLIGLVIVFPRSFNATQVEQEFVSTWGVPTNVA